MTARNSEWKAQLRREAVADAVLRIAAARLWPTIGAEELAAVVGIEVEDVRAALDRRRLVTRAKRNAARGLGQRPNAHAPAGQLWCSGMPGERGHYVVIEAMTRNRNAPSGCSNLCRVHHAEKAAIRKRRRSSAAKAA